MCVGVGKAGIATLCCPPVLLNSVVATLKLPSTRLAVVQ